MNREMKFKRVHFKDEGKKEFSHFSEWGAGIGSTSFMSPGSNNFATYFEDIQYTGLKDKNGKEIYEGDIIVAPNTERFPYKRKGTIKILPLGVYFSPIGNTVGDYICKYSSAFIMNSECIGNIFETPELLK